MHQPPREQAARSERAGRTNPASPRATGSTIPVYASAARQRWPQLLAGKRVPVLCRTGAWLVILGLLQGFCFLLLCPLVEEALPVSFAARSLPAVFPWLTQFAWTTRFPFLVSLISRVPWFDLRAGSPVAAANLCLVVFFLTFMLLFWAAGVCRRTARGLQGRSLHLLLALLWLFALGFGVLFVFLPGGVSQDALLSGLYGRLILVYHVNPYLASPALLVHDPVYQALPPGSFASPLSGPLWLDLTVPLAWLARGEPVLTLLAFRATGLCLHLLNGLLIWSILTRLKPEMRLASTLLYAWNPAILLLGIGEMRVDLAVIFFLLLAIFLLQRSSLLIGWVCLLLTALIDPFCLLLLPFFLSVIAREMRMRLHGHRLLWWSALLLLTALVIVLAYAPYWSGLGAGGIALCLREMFWPDATNSSLLAALNILPFTSWSPAAWLLTPHHWLLWPALVVGILLLIGIWIANTLEPVLLFGSWIFLALAILWPTGSPRFILLPLALSLAGSNRRTACLAHLLTIGSLVAYCLALRSDQWSGQALITIGLPTLIWGWTLFFFSTWQIAHHRNEETELVPSGKRTGISRPSWPSRPAAWLAHRASARADQGNTLRYSDPSI
jgi:hypothetical protein